MKCRFRFCFGVSCVGWAVIDVTDPEAPRVLDMGVRIFPDDREGKTDMGNFSIIFIFDYVVDC
jgi:CRISPR/Cas system Type II protein with McrA/HNH and RuvC-like nuclease domain